MDPNIQQPSNIPPQAPAPNPVSVVPPQPQIPAQPGVIAPQPTAVAQPVPVVQPVATPSPIPSLPTQPAVPTAGVPTAVQQPSPLPNTPPQVPMGSPQPPAPVANTPVLPAQPVAQVAPPGIKRPPSKVMMIATIVLTVATIGLNSYGAVHVFMVRKNKYGFAADAQKQKKDIAQKAIEASKPETEKRSDGKLNVSKLFNADSALRQQDIKAGFKEQLNMANGISFMVTDVEHGWLRQGQYSSKPAAGKEYIKIGVVVGSRAEEGTLSIYASSFKMINSKGGLQDSKYASESDLPNNGLANSVSLNPGDQVSGWIIYEIDKNETPLTFVYEAKGFGCPGNNDKDCLMKGSVKLQ